jgi:hypothetical protein
MVKIIGIRNVSFFDAHKISVLRIFLFATASRPALGPAQPPLQWVPWVLSSGVKQPEFEADKSFPSSAEVSMVWCLVKSKENFSFY